MKHLLYQPETQQNIANLPLCTPAYIQEYLDLCLELGKALPARNVLCFPYDPTVNPYTVFYHWLEQIDFQLKPQLNQETLSLLHYFAEMSYSEIRSQQLDSTTIPFAERADGKLHPYLEHFSQLYAVSELCNCLHVYNFLLENYIHESQRLRQAIHNDLQANPKGLNRLMRHYGYCPSAHGFNLSVRQFLFNEGVSRGSSLYTQLWSYITGESFQHHHPVLNPAHRTNAVDAMISNQQLAADLAKYRYYQFLQPTAEEQRFIHELRNDHGRFTNNKLLAIGADKLKRAVELSGIVNQQIVHLAKMHGIH